MYCAHLIVYFYRPCLLWALIQHQAIQTILSSGLRTAETFIIYIRCNLIVKSMHFFKDCCNQPQISYSLVQTSLITDLYIAHGYFA